MLHKSVRPDITEMIVSLALLVVICHHSDHRPATTGNKDGRTPVWEPSKNILVTGEELMTGQGINYWGRLRHVYPILE